MIPKKKQNYLVFHLLNCKIIHTNMHIRYIHYSVGNTLTAVTSPPVTPLLTASSSTAKNTAPYNTPPFQMSKLLVQKKFENIYII
jgi:hypothetical protein